MKTILKTVTIIFFCGRVWALSSEEKIQIIEELSQPLKEKKVFFQWLPSEERKELIEEKVFTQKRFVDTMNNPEIGAGGAGVYVAEDVQSSSKYGASVVRVEVAPPTQFIDLTDETTLKALNQKGITSQEVRILNPNVIIKYDPSHSWWQMKSWEGVTFHPVSKSDLMVQNSPKRAGFILSQAGRIGVSFSKSEERQIIDQAISKIRKSDDGSALLGNAVTYLSETDKQQIARRSIPLIQNNQDGVAFIQKAGPGLLEEDRTKIVQKIAHRIKDVPEGKFIWNQIQSHLVSDGDKIELMVATAAQAETSQEAKALMSQWPEILPDKETLTQAKQRVQKVLCVRNQLNKWGS